MIECVINVSEGRRPDVMQAITAAAGEDLLDVHVDADHHRSVLTTVGEAAVRRVTTEALDRLDLRRHAGAHPRIGVVDVVPFVPLGSTTLEEAIAARDRFARWAGEALGVPCFLYGPERSLPEVRRSAFRSLAPAAGPSTPHPTAGAIAVGARPVLVAYNLWLVEPDLELALSLARQLRKPSVRALGLAVGAEVQVSMNLVDPTVVGPADVFDWVSARAAVARAELVGLLPASVLATIERARWERLDVAPDRTIEQRLAGHP